MTPTPKHTPTDTLFSQFCRKGRDGKWIVVGSGVSTCQGTKSQWAWLKRNGLVVEMPGGRAMGHYYAFNLTEAGENQLEDMCNELNIAALAAVEGE